MDYNNLSRFQRALFDEIVEHCKCRSDIGMEEYMPSEFVEMEISKTRPIAKCSDKVMLVHYTVHTKCKNGKDQTQCPIAVWDCCIYSNGDISIFFDGCN